jgi:hypothetical protein
MVEFYEILRRHGLSPVQWLDQLGVLSERTILGHCLYIDQHSWSPLRTEDDLQLLADRGVTVAHCPSVFGRTGMTMETAGKYIREGVRLGIGTDSFPYNIFEEMRHAAVYSRIGSGNVYDIRTADLFTAATVGGAEALGRQDIGRLSEGAKADFAVIDTDHPMMRPLHDPLRNLIYVAAERAVRDVYIDGRQVVDSGQVLSSCASICLPRPAQANENFADVRGDPVRGFPIEGKIYGRIENSIDIASAEGGKPLFLLRYGGELEGIGQAACGWKGSGVVRRITAQMKAYPVFAPFCQFIRSRSGPVGISGPALRQDCEVLKELGKIGNGVGIDNPAGAAVDDFQLRTADVLPVGNGVQLTSGGGRDGPSQTVDDIGRDDISAVRESAVVLQVEIPGPPAVFNDPAVTEKPVRTFSVVSEQSRKQEPSDTQYRMGVVTEMRI